MSPQAIDNIKTCFDRYKKLLPDNDSDAYLVHGDFDPSNILVEKIEGQWQVVVILDWEFSFAGSFLTDIANMFRYAHKMPKEYEDVFLSELQKQGVILPQNWRITVHLLNLIALLDCLTRYDPQIAPNRLLDIGELVGYIVVQIYLVIEDYSYEKNDYIFLFIDC